MGGEGRTDVTSEGGGVVDAATELFLFDQVTAENTANTNPRMLLCISATSIRGGAAQPGHPASTVPLPATFTCRILCK